MSGKKKSGHKKPSLEKILLATAILNLSYRHSAPASGAGGGKNSGHVK